MGVNLSILENYGAKTAVRCISEDQAKMFMDAMWQQYPDRVKGFWRKGQTNWNQEREHRKCIYYLPRVVHMEGGIQHCQSTYLTMVDKGEYTIIEFSDLLLDLDLGELDAPEFDIESLFGMG